MVTLTNFPNDRLVRLYQLVSSPLQASSELDLDTSIPLWALVIAGHLEQGEKNTTQTTRFTEEGRVSIRSSASGTRFEATLLVEDKASGLVDEVTIPRAWVLDILKYGANSIYAEVPVVLRASQSAVTSVAERDDTSLVPVVGLPSVPRSTELPIQRTSFNAATYSASTPLTPPVREHYTTLEPYTTFGHSELASLGPSGLDGYTTLLPIDPARPWVLEVLSLTGLWSILEIDLLTGSTKTTTLQFSRDPALLSSLTASPPAFLNPATPEIYGWVLVAGQASAPLMTEGIESGYLVAPYLSRSFNSVQLVVKVLATGLWEVRDLPLNSDTLYLAAWWKDNTLGSEASVTMAMSGSIVVIAFESNIIQYDLVTGIAQSASSEFAISALSNVDNAGRIHNSISMTLPAGEGNVALIGTDSATISPHAPSELVYADEGSGEQVALGVLGNQGVVDGVRFLQSEALSGQEVRASMGNRVANLLAMDSNYPMVIQTREVADSGEKLGVGVASLWSYAVADTLLTRLGDKFIPRMVTFASRSHIASSELEGGSSVPYIQVTSAGLITIQHGDKGGKLIVLSENRDRVLLNYDLNRLGAVGISSVATTVQVDFRVLNNWVCLVLLRGQASSYEGLVPGKTIVETLRIIANVYKVYGRRNLTFTSAGNADFPRFRTTTPGGVAKLLSTNLFKVLLGGCAHGAGLTTHLECTASNPAVPSLASITIPANAATSSFIRVVILSTNPVKLAIAAELVGSLRYIELTAILAKMETLEGLNYISLRPIVNNVAYLTLTSTLNSPARYEALGADGKSLGTIITLHFEVGEDIEVKVTYPSLFGTDFSFRFIPPELPGIPATSLTVGDIVGLSRQARLQGVRGLFHPWNVAITAFAGALTPTSGSYSPLLTSPYPSNSPLYDEHVIRCAENCWMLTMGGELLVYSYGRWEPVIGGQNYTPVSLGTPIPRSADPSSYAAVFDTIGRYTPGIRDYRINGVYDILGYSDFIAILHKSEAGKWGIITLLTQYNLWATGTVEFILASIDTVSSATDPVTGVVTTTTTTRGYWKYRHITAPPWRYVELAPEFQVDAAGVPIEYVGVRVKGLNLDANYRATVDSIEVEVLSESGLQNYDWTRVV